MCMKLSPRRRERPVVRWSEKIWLCESMEKCDEVDLPVLFHAGTLWSPSSCSPWSCWRWRSWSRLSSPRPPSAYPPEGVRQVRFTYTFSLYIVRTIGSITGIHIQIQKELKMDVWFSLVSCNMTRATFSWNYISLKRMIGLWSVSVQNSNINTCKCACACMHAHTYSIE